MSRQRQAHTRWRGGNPVGREKGMAGVTQACCRLPRILYVLPLPSTFYPTYHLPLPTPACLRAGFGRQGGRDIPDIWAWWDGQDDVAACRTSQPLYLPSHPPRLAFHRTRQHSLRFNFSSFFLLLPCILLHTTRLVRSISPRKHTSFVWWTARMRLGCSFGGLISGTGCLLVERLATTHGTLTLKTEEKEAGTGMRSGQFLHAETAFWLPVPARLCPGSLILPLPSPRTVVSLPLSPSLPLPTFSHLSLSLQAHLPTFPHSPSLLLSLPFFYIYINVCYCVQMHMKLTFWWQLHS